MNPFARLIAGTGSFRSQLLITFSAGILALALITSLTTTWLTNRLAHAQMVAQGERITGNLARQSVLALLYASGDNAKEPANATLAYPDVRHVSIYDREHNQLLQVGQTRPVLDSIWTANDAIMILDADDAWHFAAPVYSHEHSGDEDPFVTKDPTPELLGYVYLAMDKGSLHKLQAGILINNTITIFVIALALVFALNLVIRRITRPLDHLSVTMSQAEVEGAHPYADLEGPTEIVRMARIFNQMMAALEERDRRLREHNETLESEVALRTEELVQARDAALAGSRHKSEFLANMSHELRTPIQAIIGYTELLRDELEMEGRDEAVGDLKSVLDNSRNLLAMINNILDMAKIEAGRMELRLEPVELRSVVDHVVTTMQPLMRQNGNRLEVAVEDGTTFAPVVDAAKLSQIMLNLLSNAAKFTQGGQVHLTLTATDERIRLTVADTGPGISAEQQDSIFEEFRQADMSTTRRHEGTGLGLSITRRFCHLMGGTISVASEEGKGATFAVTIPLPIGAAFGETERG